MRNYKNILQIASSTWQAYSIGVFINQVTLMLAIMLQQNSQLNHKKVNLVTLHRSNATSGHFPRIKTRDVFIW